MSIECGYCGNKVHDRDCPKYDMDLSYTPPSPLTPEEAGVEFKERYDAVKHSLEKNVNDDWTDEQIASYEELRAQREGRVPKELTTIVHTQTPEEFETLRRRVSADMERISANQEEKMCTEDSLQLGFEVKSDVFDEFSRLKAQKDAIEASSLKEKFQRVQSPASEEKDPDPLRPFESGELVCLRSHPFILMTVEKVIEGNDREVFCVWFTDRKKIRREQFPSIVLRRR